MPNKVSTRTRRQTTKQRRRSPRPMTALLLPSSWRMAMMVALALASAWSSPLAVVTVAAMEQTAEAQSVAPQEQEEQPYPFPEQRVQETPEQGQKDSCHESFLPDTDFSNININGDSNSNSNKGGLRKDDYGIWILESYQSFPVVLQQQQQQHDDQEEVTAVPHGLLLVLLYSSAKSCPTNQETWQSQLRDAADQVRRQGHPHDDDDDLRLLHFGSLDIATVEGSSSWLASVGIETTPTYVFVVARNFGEEQSPPSQQQQQQQQAFLLDYIGPCQTATDVAGTVWHYYLRLFLTGVTPRLNRSPRVRPFRQVPQDFAAQVLPRPLTDVEHLKTYWTQRLWHWVPLVAASVQHLPGGVSPRWIPQDYAYIQWLLQEEEDEEEMPTHTAANNNKKIHLLVQCQSPTTDAILLDHYAVFAEIAWVLSSRRDTWFLALDNCNNNNNNNDNNEPPEPLLQPAQVAVYSFLWNQPAADLNWTRRALSPLPTDPVQDHRDHNNNNNDNNNNHNKNDVDPQAAAKHGLRRFLIRHATPAVLWWDRLATAPIAFADDYQIHFLLLIHLHDNDVSSNNDTWDRRAPDLKQLVQTFHQECNHLKHQAGHNAICLIVPSTETRIMTTLGIDFWTPLDQWATSDMDDDKNNHQQVPQSSFPTLMITDRRPQHHFYRDGTSTTTHGVRRYVLGPREIVSPQPHEPNIENKNHVAATVSRFLQDFWNHELIPELRSEKPQEEPKINSYGVTTLTALEFQHRFQTSATTREHALVVFTSPTCGHCKRFHAHVFYPLGQIIQDLQWEQHMALYKMDVTQNEVHNMSLPWLPDVYYFPPHATEGRLLPRPIRYDSEDDFHNGVGRLRDPMELLEWWLDVMIVGGDGALDPDVLLDILDGKAKPPPAAADTKEEG